MKTHYLIAALLLCSACTKSYDWAPAGDHIRTRWAAEVGPESAHPEYPRPHLIRDNWMSLNGLWDYAITALDAPQPETPDGEILVPFCVESSLSGVGRRVGADSLLWYRRSFKAPRTHGGRLILHFDAVDWKAQVLLNGTLIGEHQGGYTAFSFDITDDLGKGEQELVVKVLDATDNDMQPRGKQRTNPHAIWYTPVTGIWQSVWLERVADAWLTDYNCIADITDGTLTVIPEVSGNADAVRVTLREGGESWDVEKGKAGALVATATCTPGAGVDLAIPDARLWSPEHPYLYSLEFEVLRSGKVLDRTKGYTALRSSTEVMDCEGNKRLGLNGEPYFQFGPLDQGWWPDGLYTAPTDEALAFDVEKTKEWGFNMIRKHIKVEPARWYYHCDRLGMLVWQDMPSVAGNIHVPGDDPNKQWGMFAYDTGWDYPLSAEAKVNYYNEWKDIIAQLKKHPSIVVWVPFNEAWGQFDTEAVVDFTRAQDPTRLINSASGGNSYHCGDILDSHNYPSPLMKFRSGGEQIDVLGEYGGIGYAVEGHLWQPDENWGYNGLRTSGEEVLDKYAHYALDDFIPEVRSGVSAGVYTQTTDVELEVNGLMTYDRAVVKMDEARLQDINRQVIAAAPRR